MLGWFMGIIFGVLAGFSSWGWPHGLGKRGGAMRRGQRKNPNTESWVRQIYRLKFQTGSGGHYLSTGKSHTLCVQQNYLPAESMNIPLGTIYRVARELNLSPWKLGLGMEGKN